MTNLETTIFETIKNNLVHGEDLSEDNNVAFFSEINWGMSTKIVRGVLANLSKKGLLIISDDELIVTL